MKNEIHPEYYPKAKIKCACGNVFTVGATKPEMETEICNNCHPFYTGKEKLMDIAGRIEKFKSRKIKAEAAKATKKTRDNSLNPKEAVISKKKSV